MLILGVDTSGKNGSIALVEWQDEHYRTLGLAPLEGGTFSAQLIPQISEMLRNHGFTKNQIGGIAVVSGPGSFTGLRVGLAAVKALAEVLGKPIAIVSLLEALALESGMEGRVLAALDAGRGEIYCAEYQVKNARALLAWQDLLRREELLSRFGDLPLVSSGQKITEIMRNPESSAIRVNAPQADAIARLGHAKILRGETVAPEALDANYIRRSDAEMKSPAGSFQP